MKNRSLAHLIEAIPKLSSSQLKCQTEHLAEQEHLQVAVLIAHLAEVSYRGLHLELGYRSLFDYCVQCLGLSEGCTALRIQVCRVSRRHPMILVALAEQRISLTVAGKLAPHLTGENYERLIADCSGMTKRVVEEYLVHLAPKPVVSPGVRKCPAPASANPVLSAEQPPRPTPPKASSMEPCQPDLFNFRFAANKEFKDKLARAAEVGGMGDAHRNMVQILDRALDAYLEKIDPVKRQERREKRAARKVEVAEAVPVEKVVRSRTIPTPLRDRLFTRSGHRCEFRSFDGRRCGERSHLAIDHITPWGFGGTSEEENLRVLCTAHNRFHADRCFGAGFMDFKIESARSMTAPRAAPIFPEETRAAPVFPEETRAGSGDRSQQFQAGGLPPNS